MFFLGVIVGFATAVVLATVVGYFLLWRDTKKYRIARLQPSALLGVVLPPVPDDQED